MRDIKKAVYALANIKAEKAQPTKDMCPLSFSITLSPNIINEALL